MEAHGEQAAEPSTKSAIIEALEAEIVELKARVAHLTNRNAELTQQLNNDRYERPPHY